MRAHLSWLVIRAAGLVLGIILVIGCQAAFVPTPARVPNTPSLAPPAETAFPFPTSRFIDISPTTRLNLQGKFVFAPGDGSILVEDAVTGDTIELIHHSLSAIAQVPAFAPDGKRVAYATLVFLAGGVVRGDVRVMDTDGKNDQMVVQGAGANDFYFYPRWSANGKLMIVTHLQNIQTLEEHDQLEIVDLNTNTAPRLILDDGRDADIAPDGKRIAFIRSVSDGSTNSLWLANADGSAAKELVPNGVFSAIMSPRFSPDGEWLAFSVHGTPQRPLPLTFQNFNRMPLIDNEEGAPCAVSVLFVCLVQTASAHGAPGAVWRVNLTSLKFEQITPIYADSPTPSWSADSSMIAIQEVSAIRLIDLAREMVYPIDSEEGGTGGFDWKE